MCGISGIIDFSSTRPAEQTLRRMLGIIRHRGPDAFGIYLDNQAGIASTRLSIIDLATGDQPISNEDQSVWVVLNGEIFNYPELREDLKAKGHRFQTRSDTEVLVHLYEDHGTGMLDKLNGQFAFAVWDCQKQTLFLARDRLGIRPCYYYLNNNRLVFASEIKALFVDPTVPRALDPRGLSEIFTFWTTIGEETPFKDIRQLKPGHYALFGRQGLTLNPYWDIRFPNTYDETRSLEDWTEELNALIKDAARIRLRADVPVGAYLSGGLDSTYISSLVKHHFNNELCTFSVAFTDSRFDETPFQKTAIRDLATDHRSVTCSETELGRLFPEVIWHTEAPVLRTAPAPLFMLSKLVRDNDFKVVLTGEGADEIFAGYNIFKEDRVRRFWARQPESKIRPLLLGKLYPYVFAAGDGKAIKFLENYFKRGLTETDSPVYSHSLRWNNTATTRSFFTQGFTSGSCGECPILPELTNAFVETLPSGFMGWDPLSRAQYMESKIFLSNYLLSSQGDRMAMGHSVEGRYPFLDHRVVEFAATIPPWYRLNGLKGKYILRKAARGRIPPEVIDRRKQPYRAPIGRCFLSEQGCDYVDDLLSEDALRKSGYFDPAKVSRLIAKGKKHGGNLSSERENMALVGILSTQLVDHYFIQNFPYRPIEEPETVTIFRNQPQTHTDRHGQKEPSVPAFMY